MLAMFGSEKAESSHLSCWRLRVAPDPGMAKIETMPVPVLQNCWHCGIEPSKIRILKVPNLVGYFSGRLQGSLVHRQNIKGSCLEIVVWIVVQLSRMARHL